MMNNELQQLDEKRRLTHWYDWVNRRRLGTTCNG